MEILKENINLKFDDVDLEQKLKNLPNSPGIYQFLNESNKVIYVGKARNLKLRVRSYFQNINTYNAKLLALVSKIRNIEIIVTDNEVEALILENNLIKSIKPRYNVLLKDDKTYPYIVITNEPFPRVFPTRKVKKDGSKYFGPYTDVKTMRSALKIIRDLFQVRTCKFYLDDEVIRKKKVRLCLEYQIKKCGGPCEGLVSFSEYQDIIHNIINLLHGKTGIIIKNLESKMLEASSAMRFEDASIIKKKIETLQIYSSRQKVLSVENVDKDIFALAYEDNDACGLVFKIRDGKLIDKRHYFLSHVEGKSEGEILECILKNYYMESDYIPDEIYLQTEPEDLDMIIKWLKEKKSGKLEIVIPKTGEKEKLVSMCRINARYMLDELKIQRMKKDNYIPYSIKALQKDLRLQALPQRIECFDISNIQGSDSVASMVVFEDGKPKKSEYRKFQIKTVTGPNDFDSIREVVYRRYKRVLDENQKLPDLIIVDGGKGQLSAACRSLDELNLNRLSIIGLAKRLEEIFFPKIEEAQMLPKTSSSLKLLQNVRDEAHRFAITYHRERRDKRTLQTELQSIESVGEVKAKKLLTEFGSVEGVKLADFDAVSKVVGHSSALKLKEHFHQNKEVV